MADSAHLRALSMSAECAPSSLPLSEFSISESWASEYRSAIHKILASFRTRQALAEIFDGIQTYYSASEMGDQESAIRLPLIADVSKKAEQETENWLTSVEQLVCDTVVDVPSARAALSTLNSEAANAHKIGALVHGFIRPAIRNILKRFLRHCESVGRHPHIGSFWQIHHPEKSAAERIQEWGEEYIFGGELVPSQDKTKVCLH
jgi:hypothetical protein